MEIDGDYGVIIPSVKGDVENKIGDFSFRFLIPYTKTYIRRYVSNKILLSSLKET